MRDKEKKSVNVRGGWREKGNVSGGSRDRGIF